VIQIVVIPRFLYSPQIAAMPQLWIGFIDIQIIIRIAIEEAIGHNKINDIVLGNHDVR